MSVPLNARVLLADDHAMVRRGLRLILAAEPDLDVVAEAGDGAEAVELALRAHVDLAVLDVSMPGVGGLEAAREIARRRPEVRTLMLSMHDHEEYLFEALSAGASGYVLKSAVDQDLVAACRAALRGESFLYAGAVSALVREHLEGNREGPARDPLSRRELEVVTLIAEGRSGTEIAELLQISPRTVERHRANILEKLELRDRVDVTRYAVRHGLIEA